MTDSSLDRAERACTELAQVGLPVTFTAIAARTGLARATPSTATPQIRAVIDQHRGQQAEPTPLSGLAAEISHLRAALEAVVGNVRQHEERLRRLERAARNPTLETR